MGFLKTNFTTNVEIRCSIFWEFLEFFNFKRFAKILFLSFESHFHNTNSSFWRLMWFSSSLFVMGWLEFRENSIMAIRKIELILKLETNSIIVYNRVQLKPYHLGFLKSKFTTNVEIECSIFWDFYLFRKLQKTLLLSSESHFHTTNSSFWR